jgi:hypothetical protein
MTAYDYRTAAERLTAFLVPNVTAPEARLIQSLVPLVLSTQRDEHYYRKRGRQTLSLIPHNLPAHDFITWFRERLVHTRTLRVTHFPYHPFWMTPNGMLYASRTTHKRDDAAHRALLEKIRRPTKPGPQRSAYFAHALDFDMKIRDVIHALQASEKPISLRAVARYFEKDDTNGLRQMRRWFSTYHMSWPEVMARAKLCPLSPEGPLATLSDDWRSQWRF